jgi:hypothetical protein
LKGFNIQKSLLDRMQAVSTTQTFNGGDFLSRDGGNREPARTLGRSVDQNGTSAALPFATAVLGTGQAEVVA